MWVVSSVYVLIIQEYFYYHYLLMLIPATLTILYFLKLYVHPQMAITILVVAILIIYCGVVSSWSVGLAGKGYVNIQEREDTADLILAEYPDLLDHPILYLDDGLAAYYFPTQSACRYVGALPIQRNKPKWDMTGYDEYQDLMGCALNYTGKYVVVYDPWFNLSYHTALKSKLDTEYNITSEHYWNVYSRS